MKNKKVIFMSSKLAVVGIGDIRRQDKGITVHLIDKLEDMFSWVDISFFQINSAGAELSDILSTVKADKVLILDTDSEGIESGEMDYLKLKLADEKTFEELLVVTIGIFSDGWGQKLSAAMGQNFFKILNQVFEITCKLLE
jgi:hydrogenase maturation protease